MHLHNCYLPCDQAHRNPSKILRSIMESRSLFQKLENSNRFDFQVVDLLNPQCILCLPTPHPSTQPKVEAQRAALSHPRRLIRLRLLYLSPSWRLWLLSSTPGPWEATLHYLCPLTALSPSLFLLLSQHPPPTVLNLASYWYFDHIILCCGKLLGHCRLLCSISGSTC